MTKESSAALQLRPETRGTFVDWTCVCVFHFPFPKMYCANLSLCSQNLIHSKAYPKTPRKIDVCCHCGITLHDTVETPAIFSQHECAQIYKHILLYVSFVAAGVVHNNCRQHCYLERRWTGTCQPSAVRLQFGSVWNNDAKHFRVSTFCLNVILSLLARLARCFSTVSVFNT